MERKDYGRGTLMGRISDSIREIVEDKDYTIKQKVDFILEYINMVAKYSGSNRMLAQKEFWKWLKTVNVRDEVIIEEL